MPGDISIIIGPNGGGKTNLLETAVLALRLFLLKSWMPRHSPTEDWQDRYDWIPNDLINQRLLEKHSAGAALEQSIELDLEVTQPDIDNIVRAKNRSNGTGGESEVTLYQLSGVVGRLMEYRGPTCRVSTPLPNREQQFATRGLSGRGYIP